MDIDHYFAKQFDIVVTDSNFKEAYKAKTVLKPDAEGIYSLQLSGKYEESDGSSDYTYLHASTKEKE